MKLTGEVHPVAAIFPMLYGEDYLELKASIEADGLLAPIVVDDDGVLIDGRNRAKACQDLAIEPRLVLLSEVAPGVDASTYILASNISRRHLSKGQRAMAVARVLLVSSKSQQESANAVGVSRQRVTQASVVLEYAPELADAVLSGSLPLDKAYETARANKEAKASEAERAARMTERLERLAQEAPDLADLVIEERMSLDEAIAAAVERSRKEREARQRMTVNFGNALVMLDGVMLADPQRVVRDWQDGQNEAWQRDGQAHLWSPDGLRSVAARIVEIAEQLEERGGRLG
jgi:ParB-like chromosome segregation protein Spo0J